MFLQEVILMVAVVTDASIVKDNDSEPGLKIFRISLPGSKLL